LNRVRIALKCNHSALAVQIGRFRITVTVHLIGRRSIVFLLDWPGPAFAWFENASHLALEAGEKAVITERPANALRGAQGGEQVRLRLARQQISEVREAITHARQCRNAVVLTA